MDYTVHALSVGTPTTHILNGKELHTGFIKHRINEADWLSKTGFRKDGQADLKNHGGEDKALLMYPLDHYDYWEARYKQSFSIPAFGENITIKELTEKDVFIGDTYQLGEAVIQVSQPRQPCYKIAEVHNIKDIPAVVTETGYTGYYFRVLQEGYVSEKDTLRLIDKASTDISISSIHKVLFHDKENREGIEKILSANALAGSLRKSFEKKLAILSTASNGNHKSCF